LPQELSAMNLRSALVPVLALPLLLAACSGKPPTPQAEAARPKHVAAPWDGLKKDEQRAKDVQKVVDQQAAEQQKQIDDDTR
jgi:hypothetical protein